MTRPRRPRYTGNPIVDGAVQAVKEMGGKALRRAVESVMEDGQNAVEDLRDEIMDARARVGDQGPLYDPEIRVRQVHPETEDDMNDRAERRRRRDERDQGREGDDDPPPSGDVADLAELIDFKDAEVFIRSGLTILADLAKNDAFSKDTVKDLESILSEINDAIEEREGEDPGDG